MKPTDELGEVLANLAKDKGIELPRIPDTPGRRAYLKFLDEQGYREDEVLPMIQRELVTPQMKGALLVALMQAFKSDDLNFVSAVIWMTHNVMIGRDDSNLLIHKLSSDLRSDFEKSNTSIPPFHAGVFPTDSYNAQCAVIDGHNLVLVDTGCMEMAEAVVVSFLSDSPVSLKAIEISSAVDRYVKSGSRADATNMNSQGVKFGSGLPATLTSNFERYILTHELGHLALGHSKNSLLQQSPRVGQSSAFIEKSETQELQADLWACRALIETARRKEDADAALALAVGGISLGIGVGLLVEASAQKHCIALPSGHPRAHDRLYMLETTYELFGAHEEAYVARRFRELLDVTIAEHYPMAEMPPLLSRELNQQLQPILDSLGVSYDSASYIRDFV